MKRDVAAYLTDAVEALDIVLSITDGRSETDYLHDRPMQLSCERCFEIVGEALNLTRKLDPDALGRIDDLQRIIDFRNRIAHGYFSLNPRQVWAIIQTHAPRLRGQLADILADVERGLESDPR